MKSWSVSLSLPSSPMYQWMRLWSDTRTPEGGWDTTIKNRPVPRGDSRPPVLVPENHVLQIQEEVLCEGAAMGSHVSALVADLYMEFFDDIALHTVSKTMEEICGQHLLHSEERGPTTWSMWRKAWSDACLTEPGTSHARRMTYERRRNIWVQSWGVMGTPLVSSADHLHLHPGGRGKGLAAQKSTTTEVIPGMSVMSYALKKAWVY